jgi:hypothetical protein
MADPLLDLTAQLGSMLRALDTLIEGELRPEIAETVDAARGMLAPSQESFGWRCTDLGARHLRWHQVRGRSSSSQREPPSPAITIRTPFSTCACWPDGS